MSRNTRAVEAQTRLARLREAEPIQVPKVALSVMAALQVLLAGRPVRPREIAVEELVDLTGETEREVQRGLQFLRDELLISRPRTKGGRGHRAPTQLLTDAEAADALRAQADAIDQR